eukprot:NODE_5272_length_712_cov_31.353846_g5249_i0.p2 GENE.NODE_5272_length_712_cov_31.353846_g5249_i0~~NODE_5272_length_712_cov_31.353846_g5249_i0.p2  ORF type:complete len:133 (+),score=37.72 NODE_5272_length_712_cov_31.353846_g5249_i0:25-399(+)
MGGGGIQRFFSTHRCNNICRSLKLPMAGQYKAQGMDGGTVVPARNAADRVDGKPLPGDKDFKAPPQMNPKEFNFSLNPAQAAHAHGRHLQYQQRLGRPQFAPQPQPMFAAPHPFAFQRPQYVYR